MHLCKWLLLWGSLTDRIHGNSRKPAVRCCSR